MPEISTPSESDDDNDNDTETELLSNQDMYHMLETIRKQYELIGTLDQARSISDCISFTRSQVKLKQKCVTDFFKTK